VEFAGEEAYGRNRFAAHIQGAILGHMIGRQPGFAANRAGRENP